MEGYSRHYNPATGIWETSLSEKPCPYCAALRAERDELRRNLSVIEAFYAAAREELTRYKEAGEWVCGSGAYEALERRQEDE